MTLTGSRTTPSPRSLPSPAIRHLLTSGSQGAHSRGLSWSPPHALFPAPLFMDDVSPAPTPLKDDVSNLALPLHLHSCHHPSWPPTGSRALLPVYSPPCTTRANQITSDSCLNPPPPSCCKQNKTQHTYGDCEVSYTWIPRSPSPLGSPPPPRCVCRQSQSPFYNICCLCTYLRRSGRNTAIGIFGYLLKGKRFGRKTKAFLSSTWLANLKKGR